MDELEHLAEQALGIEGSNQVCFDELYSPEFMQKCSDHGSIEAFIEDSPWTAESEAQFEAIPEEELDVHVA